jgi:hypothetical protein
MSVEYLIQDKTPVKINNKLKPKTPPKINLK